MLNIPENYIITYCILIGYADEEPQPTSRKSLNDIIKI